MVAKYQEVIQGIKNYAVIIIWNCCTVPSADFHLKPIFRRTFLFYGYVVGSRHILSNLSIGSSGQIASIKSVLLGTSTVCHFF